MALFKKKKKMYYFFFFFEKQTDMLSEMTSDPLPPPVISWKDKSGSVGGDKRLRGRFWMHPHMKAKLATTEGAGFAFTWVKCLCTNK